MKSAYNCVGNIVTMHCSWHEFRKLGCNTISLAYYIKFRFGLFIHESGEKRLFHYSCDGNVPPRDT